MKTDTLTEKKKPTRQDLCRPVSFDQAEAILRVYYPRYAYTKNQLRRMAKNRVIPFMRQARGGMIRRYTYTVRVADLLHAFEKQEQGELTY